MTTKTLMAKALALTSDIEESAALTAIEGEETVWRSMQAVSAPYDPLSLLKYIELTPHVKPCIISMAQNVDGYGYRSVPKEPWMDMDADQEEASKAIREALLVEQWVDREEEQLAAQMEEGELEEKIERLARAGAKPRTLRRYAALLSLVKQDDEAVGTTEPDEVPQAEGPDPIKILEDLHIRLIRERYVFKAWFKQCCSERSFTELRKIVREDIESHGWGTIEWLRDGFGRLKRLQYIPAYTVRPLMDEGQFIDVAEDASVTPLVQDREVITARRFRLYVQKVGGAKVYFKSPGDPRVVSRTTGNVYKSIEAMRAPVDAEPSGEGKDAVPANELMWLAKHDPTTPCPPPAWIGNLLAVLGIREADETNYFYLNSNAIPSGLLFVHGGTISKASKERLEQRIRHEVQGAQNSGKILVVEARPGGKSAPGEKTMLPSITFQSLREAIRNDALFTSYDERGSDRIGASFRLSPMLRGYTPNNLNRATAVAALYFAEQQVFAPLRESFDWMVNKFILPEIDVRLLNFKSNSPPTTSTEEVSDFIRAVAPHGGFVPAELREIASDTMNREFAKLDDDWTKQPLQLTLNGITDNDAAQGEGQQAGSLSARLELLEQRVAEGVTQELRAAGEDFDVVARYVSIENEEAENTGNEGGSVID